MKAQRSYRRWGFEEIGGARFHRRMYDARGRRDGQMVVEKIPTEADRLCASIAAQTRFSRSITLSWAKRNTCILETLY